MKATASQTKNMFGNQLYQQRARQALPILLRQAATQKPIFYEALANELGMPNPRNLNWVLGSVGVTLQELGRKLGWNRDIPHIQSLVINQRDRLPGSGFEGFLADRVKGYHDFSSAEKRAYLDGYWHDIFAYPRWNEVLNACGLTPSTTNAANIVDDARTGRSGGGGEGPEHLALKEFVRDNPSVVGLPTGFPRGTVEAPLPSGDKLDVLFFARNTMLAVEVKSRISNTVDLTRGLFQCVKYQAVMEAERGFKGSTYSIHAVLVVGREFPDILKPLQNSLGVEVVEVTA
ncbi:MAG: hypothetical protein V4523_16055 [Pseudomonadota bacterium]